ncbi:MAG: SLBB domain-containing protein, partial [Candidatus Omnitrophica bacterium]|nr:SLBB domain-containing protein [Candidatus Omnitrophota bacterium]
NVEVKEMTLNQIQKNIEEKLADGYMKYPLVSVSLKESRSRRFFVYGDVIRPGGYPLEDGITVLKAISVAGCFSKTNPGPGTEIKVIRPRNKGGAPETINVDVNKVLAGAPDADIKIQPEDTIMVVIPQAKFCVYGEVIKPGVYPMEENLTLLKAISVAGGFSKTNPGPGAEIKVMRQKGDTGSPEAINVDVAKVFAGSSQVDIKILPEDTIMVAVAPAKFCVYGEVNHPGVFTMEENTTLLKAISLAGGFTRFGQKGSVKILRAKADKNGLSTIKVNIRSIMNSGSDLELMPEDTIVVSEAVF